MVINRPLSALSIYYDPNKKGKQTEIILVILINVYTQSINQSIKVICNARNVVHELESEAHISRKIKVALNVLNVVT